MLISVTGSHLNTSITSAHVTLIREWRVVELLNIRTLGCPLLVVLLHPLLLHLDMVGKACLRPALHLFLHLAQPEGIHRTGIQVDNRFDGRSPLFDRLPHLRLQLRSIHVLRRHGGA